MKFPGPVLVRLLSQSKYERVQQKLSSWFVRQRFICSHLTIRILFYGGM
jgi:hypothetical protein